MKIFIGSSRESLELVREISYWLQEKGHEPVPWDQPGLFLPGDQTFLNLITIAGQVDGAVFIFAEDDKVWYRGDGATQPRDNVLVEYGLFVGKLGPKKSVICRVGNPKHTEDLRGLSYIELSPHVKERGRIALNIWANSLGAAPQDPAILNLTSQIHELKHKNEQLEYKMSFEVDRAADLERLISEQAGINFAEHDLSADGHWKLLFEYPYFEKVSVAIAEAFPSPIEMRKNLVDVGLDHIAEMIAWHSPGDPDKNALDASPDRRRYFARKLLRLFRERRNWEGFSMYLAGLPDSCNPKIEAAATNALSGRAISQRADVLS